MYIHINKKTSFVMVKIVSNLSNVDLDGGMILGTNNSVASRAGNTHKVFNILKSYKRVCSHNL